MNRAIDGVLNALDVRVEEMISACTRCGRCVEVCPMPGRTGIDASSPARVMSGVVDLLRDGSGTYEAERWANVCSRSGFCIEACDEGVNPRFLLAMARRRMLKRGSARERRAKGREMFQRMARGVRVLSRLQLPPELLERLSPSSHPECAEPPDLIFYTGCNLLRTPHIGLLCLDVLDLLGVRYEVHGGPASCCGILQARGGDDRNALRQGTRTVQRFRATGTSQVVSWCPTCQEQFSETTIPVQAGLAVPGFDLTMFPVYLASRLDELEPLMRTPVNKRVALHEHPGTAGVVEAVNRLLSAVPGVEVVELGTSLFGSSLNTLHAIPVERNRMLASELAAAEAAGVSTLAGIYHSDHRELASHHGQWSFEIVNYMEIIGESLGCTREDVFKRLKTMRDVDAILADCAGLIDAHGLDPQEARAIVLSDLLGEQLLPVDRAEHVRYLDPRPDA